MPQTNVNLIANQQSRQLPFILRAIWFVFVGWWLSGLFILFGYLFVVLILTAPLGFWFLNRVPQAQTLRQRSTELIISEREGSTYISEMTKNQRAWYWRLLYLPLGLLLGLVWLVIAWLVSLTIIGLPLSVYMIDRSPGIITLQRH